MISGVLLLDKPTGISSTDVVRQVRRQFNTGEVGHAGTLDPNASGVLLVCVGEATKVVPFLTTHDKRYTTEAVLGEERVTDDAEGEVIVTAPWEHVTEQALRTALSTFEGTIQQAPPRVSAIKQGGRRLYERVRAGEDVEADLHLREVIAHSLTLTSFDPPRFALDMHVGKGFYVRSLVRDLGRAVGSAAHVVTLRRLSVGQFRVEDADPERLLTIEQALAHLPLAQAGERGAWRLRNGQHVPLGEDVEVTVAAPLYRLHGPAGELLAVVAPDEEGVLHVVRGFRSDLR